MTALYQKVQSNILDQISSGALKVGDRLPPEDEYAAQLGVSRSTLRHAFSALERAGVLLRRKRAGTEIIADRPRQHFNMRTGGIHELLSLGRDTAFRITGTRTVAGDAVPELKGWSSETGHWLEVSGTRSLAGEATPFSVNRVYVPARWFGIEPILTESETSVFQTIERTFGVAVSRVSQSTRAVACPAGIASEIGLEPGVPVLLIEAQLFENEHSLLEISLAWFDPDRFQIQTTVEIE